MESLNLPAGQYETELSIKYKNKTPYRHVSPYNMEAFMPGTVRQICVKVGDKVKKGDKVLILDAMKMDNELLAPVDGIVKSICVEEGHSIPKHALLIEFLVSPKTGCTSAKLKQAWLCSRFALFFETRTQSRTSVRD